MLGCSGGFLRELGLALTFEFSLHSDVGQALLLDLGQLHDLGFCGCLEVFELLAGLRGGVALALQIRTLCSDVLHHGVEVVEFHRRRTPCHRCLMIGGDAGVGLVEIDQQRERAAGIDEAALRVLLQAASHRSGLGFDRCEVVLRCLDPEFERVESGLRIEHRLCSGVGAVTSGLDLLGSTDGSGVLRARDGEWQRGESDGDRDRQGEERERSSRSGAADRSDSQHGGRA